jgi:hypothetical protein
MTEMSPLGTLGTLRAVARNWSMAVTFGSGRSGGTHAG